LSFAKAKKKIFYDELANENNKHPSMMEIKEHWIATINKGN
jgi:hypothetical protein